MAFLKKINENWQPIEFPGIQVGETVDFGGPNEALVRGGMALLVDKDGNEIELPGQEFECPVCFKRVEGLQDFIDHVSKHMPKPEEKESVATAVDEKESVEDTKTEEAKKADIRAKRLAALEKARAARAAKKKEAEGKEKESGEEK